MATKRARTQTTRTKVTMSKSADNFTPIAHSIGSTRDFVVGTFTAAHPLRLNKKAVLYALKRKDLPVFEQVGDNLGAMILFMQQAQHMWDKIASGEINGYPPQAAQPKADSGQFELDNL